MPTQFDAIVIGTGQAGPSLAARLANAGRKVAIVERKLFGGTCVNTGCIPTKTMVASAYAAHMARRAADFGVGIEGAVSVDMKRVKARKDEISGKSRTGVEGWLKNLPNCTVYEGHARFESPTAIAVGDSRLTAPRIFINVGGRAVIPDMPGVDQVPFLTNSSMMQVDFLPRHLVIVGGSYIGLEFGQMFRRFGSEVTIIQRGARLMMTEDEDVSDEVAAIFRDDGITILTSSTPVRVEPAGSGRLRLTVRTDDGERQLDGSHLLSAIGRIPNTEALAPEATGISLNDRGFIEVNEYLQTSPWHLCDGGRQGWTGVHPPLLRRLPHPGRQPHQATEGQH